MIEPRSPKYRSGQRVKAAIDLLNDGSFPGASAEECLAASGTLVRSSRSVAILKRTYPFI
jgi:hypothetical protein